MLRRAMISVASIALAIALSACASSGPGTPMSPIATGSTPQEGVRGTPVVAGRPARVYILAAYDAACKTIAPPPIVIEKQPTQGTVTLQPGQDTSVMTSAKGTCIGAKVKGTGIYYTANPGATGGDSFTISARMGSSEVTTKTFDIKIAE